MFPSASILCIARTTCTCIRVTFHFCVFVFHFEFGPVHFNFENCINFSPCRFTDLTQTFPLSRGKGSRDPEDVGAVGYFKGTVKMYPLPDDGSPEPKPLLANVPSTAPIDVIVRVYIVRVSSHVINRTGHVTITWHTMVIIYYMSGGDIVYLYKSWYM